MKKLYLILLILLCIFSLNIQAQAKSSSYSVGTNAKFVEMLKQYYYEMQKEQQRLEEEQKVQDNLIQLFGYVPSDDEIMLTKRVAMAEAGNTEPIEGIERVIEVIANRVRSNKFPNTITEVCYQKHQFQTVIEGTIWKYEINDNVEEAWNNLVERGYCVDEYVLFFTAGYYNPYCIPGYKLGHHYFGY